MDFFSRYNEEQSLNAEKHDRFKKATSDLFNNDFKGFDFNVGEKKFRYGVNNPTSLAEQQSDVSNILGKFLGKNGEVTDHKEYHKAMYAASNVDKIASHFYEQGKADAVKDVINSSKNISDSPRQTASDSVFINGLKVKAISGADSTKLKIKNRKFNN
jgi:inorganic pyrophosphatase/exopolyphosphatase